MNKLNLPKFDIKIELRDNNQFVFDIVRKKMVVLTPEEWVRQNFLHYLIEVLKFPKGLIKVETELEYNRLSKRADIEVLDRAGKPMMIIECKSTKIKIDESVLKQVSVYNQVYKAPYIAVTNGLQHLCFKVDFDKLSVQQVAFESYDLMA